MSYDNLKKDYSKERIEIIEIDLEKCSRTYGAAPCTASVGVTGSERCRNSLETCQDPPNYDGSATLTTRYCTNRTPLPAGIDAIPSIKSVNVTPSKIDVKGGLGERAQLTANFEDHPHSDRDTDPYYTTRTYDPIERGTYWTKLRAIFPNYQNKSVRHIVGYLVDGVYNPANFETRYYILDKMTVGGKQASIVAKDPLSLVMQGKALMPAPSKGKLSASLTNVATSATLAPAGVGNDEYPASGYVVIDKEVMSFTRSGDTLTLTRAQRNTTAAAHNINATVQLAYYKNDQVHEIVKDAFALAGIDSSFIPSAAWQAEIDTFLIGLLEGMICKPTDVKKILVELSEAQPHYLWWNERTQKIELTALKAPPETAEALTMEGELLQDQTKIKDDPKQRLSTIFVNYGQVDPTKKLDEPNNYEQTYARIDPESIIKHGSGATKTIYSRWINTNNSARARQLAAMIGRRFSDVPRIINFNLDPKDSDLWIGQSIAINHRDMIDPTTLLPVDTIFQITSASETENAFNYEGLEFAYGGALSDDEAGGETGVNLVYLDIDQRNINLRTVYDANYPTPDASTKAKFIVTNSKTIGSTSTSTVSMDTGFWPAGAIVTLQVDASCFVVGKGGNGGTTGLLNGRAGGKALILNHDLTLINNGVIGGGGGGGGAGVSSGAGGIGTAGGGGGAGDQVGIMGITELDGAFPDNINSSENGTLESGGNGGYVGWGSAGEPENARGGYGGGLGQAGSSGAGDSSANSGGAAGAAIDKNGYTLTETVLGDIRGSILI